MENDEGREKNKGNEQKPYKMGGLSFYFVFFHGRIDFYGLLLPGDISRAEREQGFIHTSAGERISHLVPGAARDAPQIFHTG